MPEQVEHHALSAFLGGARVGAEVFALRPDYRALLLAVDGLVPGPSDSVSDALLRDAEAAAAEALDEREVHDLPHVAAWRDAYRAFGAKPQRTRNSLEALLRRWLAHFEPPEGPAPGSR